MFMVTCNDELFCAKVEHIYEKNDDKEKESKEKKHILSNSLPYTNP